MNIVRLKLATFSKRPNREPSKWANMTGSDKNQNIHGMLVRSVSFIQAITNSISIGNCLIWTHVQRSPMMIGVLSMLNMLFSVLLCACILFMVSLSGCAL